MSESFPKLSLKDHIKQFKANHQDVHQRGDIFVGHTYLKDPFSYMEDPSSKPEPTLDRLSVLEPLKEGGHRRIEFDNFGHISRNFVYGEDGAQRYQVDYLRPVNGQYRTEVALQTRAQRVLDAPEAPIHYIRHSGHEHASSTISAKIFRMQFKSVLEALHDLIPPEEQYRTSEFKTRD